MTPLFVPGVYKLPEHPARLFCVLPLEDFEKKSAIMVSKLVEAADARAALLLARARGLDEWLLSTGRAADGWYVAEWRESGFEDPVYFPRDAT